MPVGQGDLTLDATHPVITMIVAGQPLRLLVDMAQSDTIELDAGVAARLPLRWTQGRDLEIGRVRLEGKTAPTTLVAQGRTTPALVSTHGRSVGDGVDGLIGPDLLPDATIHWTRADAPSPTGTRIFPLTLDTGLGLVSQDSELPLPIRLRFSLTRGASEATAAAGSFLAQRYGGRFVGVAEGHVAMLGVSRPTRTLALERAPAIAGFRFDRLAVRISDFRGANPLPADPGEAGDIVVAKREPPQPAQSWITIARDRLDRCADVTYTAQPRTLTLSCAFD